MHRLILAPAPALALSLAAPLAAQDMRRDWTDVSRADVTRLTVDPREIRSGGPRRDGVPPLDAVRMIPPSAEARLEAREPVLVFAPAGSFAGADPIRRLIWHEFVNATVAGQPVAVTYCPLCTTAMVFGRRHRGRVPSFGVSGRLRFSDLVLDDRETESW